MAGSAIIKGNLSVGEFTMILSYFSMMINSSKLVSTFTTQYADATSSLSRIKKYKSLNSETVLILDEPTNQLDYNSKQELLSYLKRVKKDKIIIISSHDYNIEQISDEIIEL